MTETDAEKKARVLKDDERFRAGARATGKALQASRARRLADEAARDESARQKPKDDDAQT